MVSALKDTVDALQCIGYQMHEENFHFKLMYVQCEEFTWKQMIKSGCQGFRPIRLIEKSVLP